MSSLKFERAVANQSGAMEAETISKNGLISKCQMSRVNKIKRIIIIFLLFFAANTIGAFAQSSASYYVNAATGNDKNDGLSELTPFGTLFHACTKTRNGTINKITVIGEINMENYLYGNINENFLVMFNFKNSQEITITGRPSATDAERAIISAKGGRKAVVWITAGMSIRFEHIEISGGEGNNGNGILIREGATVTIGKGAIIFNNEGRGVSISEGNCIIDGGEIRNNKIAGVYILNNSSLILRNGDIRGNSASSHAGGVFVDTNARFTMSGGTITNNKATNGDGGGVYVRGRFEQTGGSITGNSATGFGGGVAVTSGGRFDHTGGTIPNNTAKSGSNPNVFRAQGSFGKDLLDSDGNEINKNAAPRYAVR